MEQTLVQRIVAAAFLVENDQGELALIELPTLDPTESSGLFKAHVKEAEVRQFGFQEPDRLTGYEVNVHLTTPPNLAYAETIMRARYVGPGVRIVGSDEA